ncbi:hypothetical protein OSTOST_21918 [Ostertagia ostertagi]
MGGIPGPLGINACHGFGGNQLIRLNTEGQLAQGEWCLTPKGVRVEANHCVKGTVNGPWAYDEETGHIILQHVFAVFASPVDNPLRAISH